MRYATLGFCHWLTKLILISTMRSILQLQSSVLIVLHGIHYLLLANVWLILLWQYSIANFAADVIYLNEVWFRLAWELLL